MQINGFHMNIVNLILANYSSPTVINALSPKNFC